LLQQANHSLPQIQQDLFDFIADKAGQQVTRPAIMSGNRSSDNLSVRASAPEKHDVVSRAFVRRFP
jgi:hypothetical protein